MPSVQYFILKDLGADYVDGHGWYFRAIRIIRA